jgi:hypothetical protein
MMISGEKKLLCEIILSAATPVAHNPATLQGKRRLKSLAEGRSQIAIINFGKV